ncbi:terpene synthase family protein [Nonomuraea endophytica]|uniref:terpene synthase family protein n=1 Tax=Nonomuraea endophytica TaxID=714136 RepID=UPI0037C9C3AB
MRALTCATNFLVTTYNDIASYRREIDQGSPESNLVHVVAARLGCGPQDAMVETIALANRVMHLFATLTETPAKRLPPVGAYAWLPAHKVRGNIDWQRTVPRYSGPAAEPLFTFADAPSDDRWEPIAASVAWWWGASGPGTRTGLGPVVFGLTMPVSLSRSTTMELAMARLSSDKTPSNSILKSFIE